MRKFNKLACAVPFFLTTALGVSACSETVTCDKSHLSKHVATAGETYWDDARHIAPDLDRQFVIDELKRINNTDSNSIMEGRTVITLPPANSCHN